MTEEVLYAKVARDDRKLFCNLVLFQTSSAVSIEWDNTKFILRFRYADHWTKTNKAIDIVDFMEFITEYVNVEWYITSKVLQVLIIEEKEKRA